MKILVTGSGTLVGNTVSKFLSRYFKIISTYRSTYPKNLQHIKNINIQKLDLDKEIKIKNDFSFIVHCASAIPDYNLSKAKLKKTNIDGFRNLLNYVNKKKIKKIILLSSLSVYGKINSKQVTEKTSINNPDFYGRTKFIMEKDLIEFSKKKNFEYLILRLPGIIGLDSQHNFLSKLIFSIKGNINNLILFNPDLKFNNLLHVKTLSKVIKKCIESNKISGIFLLGSKHPVKIKHLMKSIKKFKKIKIKYKSNSNGFNLDISKALRYKIPLDSTKKVFLSFLNENLKNN